MRLTAFLVFLCFLIVASGCGYTSVSLLPPKLDSIHVENFANKIDIAREVSDKRASYSYWPGLETNITRAVIERFVLDKNLDVKSKDKATLLLKGALTDYRQIPLSYSGENVEEFRVEVFVDIELYNNLTGELMWKETSFMGESTYTISGPHTKTEAQAVSEAVNDLAPRIVERTVDVW
jgi:hypothetical protein